MYAAVVDPYCYSGAGVLKNRLGLRDQAALDAFEAEATAQRFAEPLPVGRFDAGHYRAVHRHLFGDVYAWAGRYRTVRIAKGSSMFCYPEHIRTEMRRVFGELKTAQWRGAADPTGFASGLAHFLAELNAIHPFRDGNGRAQLAFASLLGFRSGRPLHLERIEPEPFLGAMIDSFHGREDRLAEAILGLL